MGHFSISEQQVLDEVERAYDIFKECVRKHDMPFEKAFLEAEDIFKTNIKGSYPVPASREEVMICALDAWEKIRHGFRKRCYDVFLESEKEKKVQAIRAVQVDSLILPYILETGLPYRLEYQMYRVKVSLLIDRSKEFTFYIRYKDFQNGGVLEHLPKVMDMVPLLKDFGPQISLMSRKDSISGAGWVFPSETEIK